MVFVIPGGPWGVLLGSREVRGGLWRGLGVPGRFQRCPRGLPNMTSFSFFGGEFAHGLMKYGHVRNGGHFVKRSVVMVSCYVFIVFRSL